MVSHCNKTKPQREDLVFEEKRKRWEHDATLSKAGIRWKIKMREREKGRKKMRQREKKSNIEKNGKKAE